jgi:hypothetical protein
MRQSTIYLSDYFTLPQPLGAETQADYRRKLRHRKLVWALLPRVLEAVGLLAMVGLMLLGATVCALGLG